MKTLNELFEAAKDIAHFMGHGWEAKKKELADQPGHGDVTICYDPYRIAIGTSDYSHLRGKYVFRGLWPCTAVDSVLGAHVVYAPENRDDFVINVSQAKTAQLIALEIERRLLGAMDEKYIREFERQVARMKNDELDRTAQLKQAARLAKILGTDNVRNGQQIDYVHAYKHGVSEFRVNHDGTKVERVLITSIPVDVAVEVFELLRNRVSK